MVNITDVYNRQSKKMQYVFINEEYLVVATYDYIRNELPTDTEAEDFILYQVAVENLTHEPAWDNNDMNNLPDDIAELIFDCWSLFIKEYCKYTKDTFICKLDALPIELYDKVSREYSHWLAENELDPVTDGYEIIIDEKYLVATEYDVNGKAAVALQKHLNDWMPANDADDQTMDYWYREKIHIIVGDKCFTFINGADIYNALGYLAKNIIDEQ